MKIVPPNGMRFEEAKPGGNNFHPEDITATKRLMAKCPNAVIYGLRIGHRAAYRLGGFSKVSD